MKRWTITMLAAAALLSTPQTLLAGDAFLKLGINLDDGLGGFSDRWFASVGSDWGAFGSNGFVGLEFQGAYRNRTVGALDIQTVPANVFINLKWKSDQEEIRPYAGGGFGLVSSYVKVTSGGASDSEWVKDGGFQIMGGVEFNRKFVVEFMGQTILESNAGWLWSILGGVRF